MKKEKNFPKIGRLIFLGLVIYFGVLIAQDIFNYYNLLSEKNHLKKEIASIKNSYQSYNKILASLNTEAYLEKIAREKLGFVKKGEILYRIQRVAKRKSVRSD